MGAMGGLLGTAGGVNGTGMSGPEQASMQAPVTASQANDQYTAAQRSMNAQNALLTALRGQHGIQNQSQVYNQMQGVANGTGPNPAQAMLNNATGQNVANQAALMAGQRGASSNVGMMARQAAQQGSATQQNAAGQGAAMQATQSLNALNAAGSMANGMAANQIGQTNANTSARQAEQSNILNAINAQNNSAVSSQSSVNNVNGQLANTTMQGQQGLIGGMMSSIGGGMSMAEGGEVPPAGKVEAAPQSAPMVAMDTSSKEVPAIAPAAMAPIAAPSTPDIDAPSFSSQVQAGSAPAVSTPSFSSDNAGADALAKGMGSMGAGAMKGITGMMGGGGDSGGGGGIMSMLPMLAMLADGGPVSQAPTAQAAPPSPSGPKSNFGKYIKGVDSGKATAPAATPQFTTGAGALAQGAADLGKGIKSAMSSASAAAAPIQTVGGGGGSFIKQFAQGGPVPAMVSPGEQYLSPEDVNKVEHGANPLSVGRKIPGKATVKGNSYANDTVPATLEEGGIVLPKSVMESKHPHWAAHAFVSQIMAKKGKSLPKKGK